MVVRGVVPRLHQVSGGLGTMCIASTRAAAPGIAYPLSCVQWKRMLSMQIDHDMHGI